MMPNAMYEPDAVKRKDAWFIWRAGGLKPDLVMSEKVIDDWHTVIVPFWRHLGWCLMMAPVVLLRTFARWIW